MKGLTSRSVNVTGAVLKDKFGDELNSAFEAFWRHLQEHSTDKKDELQSLNGHTAKRDALAKYLVDLIASGTRVS